MRTVALLFVFALPGACGPFSYDFVMGPFTGVGSGSSSISFDGWTATWVASQILIPSVNAITVTSQPNFVVFGAPAETYSLRSLQLGFFSPFNAGLMTADWASTNPNLPEIIYATRLTTLPDQPGAFQQFDTDVVGVPQLTIPNAFLTITEGGITPVAITYQVLPLGSGQYRYLFNVTGGPLTLLEDFDILFPVDLYGNLSSAVVGSGFTSFLFEPGNPPGVAGDYIALAGTNPSQTGPFTVDFTYLGIGAPGAQQFSVHQYIGSPNSDNLVILRTIQSSGVTTPLQATATPEPRADSLTCTGLIACLLAGVWRRRRGAASLWRRVRVKDAPTSRNSLGISLVGLTFIVSAGFTSSTLMGTTLSITNYQLIETHQISLTKVSATYSVVLTNSGPTLDSVVAIATSRDLSSVTIPPGKGTLNFAPVHEITQVASTDTLTIVVDRKIRFDFSKVQWTFQVPATLLQQGPKLVGTGAVGNFINQGEAVALSGDGNTAIVGGLNDNDGVGGAWVFYRNNGVWTQQSPKLIGSGAVGGAAQGSGVALSADGNTALVCGLGDDARTGAVWVFTRSDGIWTQQGPKLVGAGSHAGSQVGISAALSADGNTAFVGGNGDNNITGAAWVFTRANGVWSQQGPKLVGANTIGRAEQGRAVALSADGNTALVGGDGDNNGVGAAWVYTRTASVWTQQGSKLIGTGALNGRSQQGWSVALSADGNIAAEVGPGQVWFFIRNESIWVQAEGPYSVGDAGIQAVSLSADGNIVLVGAYGDANNTGGAWVFTRNTDDLNLQVSKLLGGGAINPASQGFSLALSSGAKTALIGGLSDNQNRGAAWVFEAIPVASQIQ